MSNYCVMCEAPMPDNQGSKTCSMCYGDHDHGTDGYYTDWLNQYYENTDSHEEYYDGEYYNEYPQDEDYGFKE